MLASQSCHARPTDWVIRAADLGARDGTGTVAAAFEASHLVLWMAAFLGCHVVITRVCLCLIMHMCDCPLFNCVG